MRSLRASLSIELLTASAHAMGQDASAPIPRPSPHVHVSYPAPAGPAAAARLQQLADDLASADKAVRLDAARRLGHAVNVDPVAAAAHLATALKDSEAAVREQAAEGLAHATPTPGGIEALMLALRDVAPPVRRASAAALGEIGAPAASAGPVLAAAISDPDIHVRRAAAEAIGKVGATSPEVLAALSAVLGSTDDSALRERAAHSLGQPHHGDEGFRLLLSALADPVAGVRREVVHALSAMPREHAAHTEPALRRAVSSDGDPAVRVEAVHGLFRLGGAGVAGLQEALADQDFLVRWWAIVHLRDLGPTAAAALPALERVAAGDDRPSLRASAQRAIDAIRGAVRTP